MCRNLQFFNRKIFEMRNKSRCGEVVFKQEEGFRDCRERKEFKKEKRE